MPCANWYDDRQEADRVRRSRGAGDHGRWPRAAEELALTSSDFAAVFLALSRGPLSPAEIVIKTGVSARVVDEVVRILSLTGAVARAGDRYVARYSDASDGEHGLLVGVNRAHA